MLHLPALQGVDLLLQHLDSLHELPGHVLGLCGEGHLHDGTGLVQGVGFVLGVLVEFGRVEALDVAELGRVVDPVLGALHVLNICIIFSYFGEIDYKSLKIKI